MERDSENLLRWRNDLETRHNSLNTGEVSPQEHARWFADMLVNYPHQVLIADFDCVSVGVFRLDWRLEFRVLDILCYLQVASDDRHNLDPPLPILHGGHRVQADDRP